MYCRCRNVRRGYILSRSHIGLSFNFKIGPPHLPCAALVAVPRTCVCSFLFLTWHPATWEGPAQRHRICKLNFTSLKCQASRRTGAESVFLQTGHLCLPCRHKTTMAFLHRCPIPSSFNRDQGAAGSLETQSQSIG